MTVSTPFYTVVYDINGDIREARFSADTKDHALGDAMLLGDILERGDRRFRIWESGGGIIRQHGMGLQQSLGV